MHEKLFTILSSSSVGIGNFYDSSKNIFRIYPKFIPNGEMDEITFNSCLVYNINQAQVNYRSTLYSVQLTVFSKDYSNARVLAIGIKGLFNNQVFDDEPNVFMSTTVTDMVELEYDSDVGLFGVAVNLLIKTGVPQ